MPNLVVVDTSCLIVLDRIGQLDLLLKLYGSVWITREVAEEFGAGRLPKWIKIKPLKDTTCKRALTAHVDAGEASIIALALENEGALAVIDELRGRRLADQLGIKITGTLGVLLRGKRDGAIPSLRESVKRIQAAGFFVREEMIAELLRQAGE